MTMIQILLYAAMATVALVLVAGLVNMFVESPGRISRSNLFMRARVALQFVAIALLVAAGLAAGVF